MNSSINKNILLETSSSLPSVQQFAFEQQTFLGASIRNISINAGYGDSVTTLAVDLVNDEINISDEQPLGLGDDVYHNGRFDRFAPPPVGSPVFFKMGLKKAPIDEAYKSVYDSIYGTNVSAQSIGRNHLCFGGILQSYTQNRGPGGNPLYAVQVVDPREILSNVTLILNNYAGTTFNNKNMFNIYGFLEYNISPGLKNTLSSGGIDVFRKIVNSDGTYRFTGSDMYGTPPTNRSILDPPNYFPITGTGFSRRGQQGIPFYRIDQAFGAMLNAYGQLPTEYENAGFGGFINFRGFNYIVDLSGLKSLPPYYFIDYDQMTLLDLCLEICDVTNSELFVSLLPIIPGHPFSAPYFAWNSRFGSIPDKLIAGIIRVDGIDRSFQPRYGAIKDYIDRLTRSGVPVENQDVGFELANVTTDKFVVGAQEVDMYYFSSNADRDNIEYITGDLNLANQWRLKTSLKQQILPYYGLLGNRAVTIPKGFGAYQQILLDSSSLNANGVGNYYVATELELRAALVSYERWSEFLLFYNDVYMESLEDDDDVQGALIEQTPARLVNAPVEISFNYGVTVPRSVFDSENNSYGKDDLPKSPCNPPYGYPLYYKRATKIGVQGAGLTDLYSRFTGVVTNIAALGGAQTKDQLLTLVDSIWQDLESQSKGDLTELEKELIAALKRIKNDPNNINKADVVALVSNFEAGLEKGIKIMNRLQKQTKENSMKVYNFVRSIAEECLGKKFLVKIPRVPNLKYKNTITSNRGIYTQGPFGFMPRLNDEPEPSGTQRLISNDYSMMASFLDVDTYSTNSRLLSTVGALQLNFNPLVDNYEFNYTPEKNGGYFSFDLLENFSPQQSPSIRYGLIPQDLTNFVLDNSRISAYVRFDHSQFLSFNSIDPSSFSQQVFTNRGFVPDLAYTLDNVGEDRSDFVSFQDKEYYKSESPPKPTTIAFVKCDVDEKLYMPPISGSGSSFVHATSVRDIGRFSVPRKIYFEDTDNYELSAQYYKYHFIPLPQSSGTLANDIFFLRDRKGIIETNLELLDTNHVYALITLPNRVVPTVDTRFRDATYQTANTTSIKHMLTMDVVKIPEFAEPAYINKKQSTGGFRVPENIRQNAVAAYKAALENTITFSLPNRINFSAPSPVYPDLVAIPLLSKERCYGPWLSSPNSIGGKIEFSKDENLAPWNFAGYDLLNAAGSNLASFAGNVLLQSERGGFVIPTVPAGISIGRFLSNFGPLVTNITIDISNDAIRSTIKMDLYTVSFGKLQKQKQDAIANIGRERQKITDERNALIRQGVGKGQRNVNYSLIYQSLKNNKLDNLHTYYQADTPNMTNLVASVDETRNYLRIRNFGSNQSPQPLPQYNTSTSLQSLDQTQDTASYLPDSLGGYKKYYQSASLNLNEFFAPFSYESHPAMPSVKDNNLNSTQIFYS